MLSTNTLEELIPLTIHLWD